MNQPLKPSEHALISTGSDIPEDRSTPTLITQPALTWADGGARHNSRIASYLEIPFVHKRLILGCTLLGMLLGWITIVAWPRTYESEAKLMIRVGRESVSLDPTATTSATLMLQKTQEEEINSALGVLNSRQIAETVVDELGADAILSGILPDALSDGVSSDGGIVESTKRIAADSLQSVLQSAGVKDDISDRELAVRKLQSSLGIYAPRQSAVITIDASSRTPKMAQAIVKEVTESFLDEHSKGAHTSGSLDFFEQQSADVENQLRELVAARSKFMQEHKIISIDANRDLLQQRLAGIDRDLVTASGQLEQAGSEIEDLQSKIAATDDQIVASSDSTWTEVRQLIYALELEEQRNAAIYTANHPKLQEVRAKLDGAQEILAKLKSERVDESITPNPTKTRLREELQRQQTHVVGLVSMIEQKEAQRAEMERHTSELLEYERHLTQTDRDIRLTENSLGMLREKLEEARVNDELQSTTISNVHVFQPATFVERAISPKKKVVGAGFLLLGLTAGLGLSFLRQTTSRSLRTSEDVEYELGVSVVSSIPRMPRMKALQLGERKLYRETCQALISEILLSPRRPRQTPGRSVAIIGVDAGAGASTLAANLAVTGSVDCRAKTILVDADSRQRSVSTMFGLNGMPGLVELVNSSASHDECLQRAQNAPIDLIASASDSCHEPLTASAPEIVQALQAYQHECDLLIVDLPPASQPDLAVALAQHLDCVLVVIESEQTQAVAAERLLRRLSESNTEVIGVVLNKTHSYLPKFIRRFVTPRV